MTNLFFKLSILLIVSALGICFSRAVGAGFITALGPIIFFSPTSDAGAADPAWDICAIALGPFNFIAFAICDKPSIYLSSEIPNWPLTALPSWDTYKCSVIIIPMALPLARSL